MSDRPYTAYRLSTDGKRTKRNIRSGLSLSECKSLPKGKRMDEDGEYVWQYGVYGIGEAR